MPKERVYLVGERARASLLVVIAAGALGFLYLFDPSNSGLYPPSPFRELTGYYCPGCGTLRALHQLTRGHLAVALGLNPLMVFSLPFIGYYFASQAKIAVSGSPLRTFFIKPGYIWTLLAIILSYWLLRNIPVYPFSLLAP